MNILAFDTSTAVGNVAVSVDGEIVELNKTDSKLSHSQTLIPTIQKTLAGASLDISKINLVGVSVGPGSFMGVKIGLAAAKAFCLSLSIPLVCFNALELLAFNQYGTSDKIVPFIYARQGYIYTAIYNTILEPIVPPKFVAIVDFFGEIEGEFTLVGEYFTELEKHLYQKRYKFVKKEQSRLFAVNIIDRIAQNKQKYHFNPEKISRVVPLYLQVSQAQRQMENKTGN